MDFVHSKPSTGGDKSRMDWRQGCGEVLVDQLNIDLNIAQSDMSSSVARGRSMVRVHLFNCHINIVSKPDVVMKVKRYLLSML